MGGEVSALGSSEIWSAGQQARKQNLLIVALLEQASIRSVGDVQRHRSYVNLGLFGFRSLRVST